MSSEVTACLLTYNRAHLLPKTIDSLLAQTKRDFELHISDDASTDSTEIICRDYCRRYKQVRYFRNNSNLGMPGNLNAALQRTDSRYVLNLHDGDIYRKDLIEKCYIALETYHSAGFVFNAYRVIDSNRNEHVFQEPYEQLISGHSLGARLLSSWSSCVFGTVMARREIYEKLGWFDPQFGNFSDVDMWMRIARDNNVAYVSEPLMTVMPRDPTRFYAFVHWEVLFWKLGMHTLNLSRYQDTLPELVSDLSRRYKQRRRRYLAYNMLLCVKHRRWDRVKEGFAIWSDADDIWLKLWGRTLGRSQNAPNWYDANHHWGMAQIKADRSHNILAGKE